MLQRVNALKKYFYGFNSAAKLWSTETEKVSLIPVKLITGKYVACREELKFWNDTIACSLCKSNQP